MLEGKLGGGGVIAGSEDPAYIGAGAGVGDEVEGGKIGGIFRGVGGGDEDGFAGEGGGDGVERVGESVGRERGKADEELRGGVARGREDRAGFRVCGGLGGVGSEWAGGHGVGGRY